MIDFEKAEKAVLDMLRIKKNSSPKDGGLFEIGVNPWDHREFIQKKEEFICILNLLKQKGYVYEYKYNECGFYPEDYINDVQVETFRKLELLPAIFEIKLANNFDQLYDKKTGNINERISSKLPIEMRSDENIYIKGAANPLIKKAANKAYFLMVGCIQNSNDRGNSMDVLIEDLFEFLKRKTELRFRLPNCGNKNQKYQYMRTTFNNIKREVEKVEDYIKLDISKKDRFTWVIKNLGS
jgi:hypothetical protein